MPYYIVKFSGRQQLSRIGPFMPIALVLNLLDRCLYYEQLSDPMREMRPKMAWYRDIAWEIQGTEKEGSPEGLTTTFLRFEP